MNQARQAIFVIRKANKLWFVETSDEFLLGPFLPNIALEVAATRAIFASGCGLEARIYICEDYGEKRLCRIIEDINDPERCRKCESDWQASSALPKQCALRTAF